MVDFSIIIIVALSGVISFYSGFLKGLLSLLAWVFSFMIAINFLTELASLLVLMIPFTDLRLAVALITLFLAAFITFEWFTYLILNSIGPTKLSMLERVLGIVFGVARGGVIVTMLIMLLGLTILPSQPLWQKSNMIRHFKPIVEQLREDLPPKIALEFNFEPPPEHQTPSF